MNKRNKIFIGALILLFLIACLVVFIKFNEIHFKGGVEYKVTNDGIEAVGK